jgi:methionyl-tRNA formyltransferase
MRDAITGGTVFWLNNGIDRGDIAYQDICFIDPKMYGIDPRKAAKLLWEHELQAMGLRLIEKALTDISKGIIIKNPQKKEYSTFEPNTDVKDVFKPDLLMLEQFASPST